MSNRRKAVQKQTLSQPFKFADSELLMANARELIGTQGPISQSTLLHWSHKTHMPAYSLGDIIGTNRLNDLNAVTTPNQVLGLGTGVQPHWIAMGRQPEIAQVYADLWANGHKFHVMLARHHGQQNIHYSTQREHGELFENVFDNFIRMSPQWQPTFPLYNYSLGNSAAPVIRRFMLGEGAQMALMKSKITKEGEFKEALYASSRYFLTYLQKSNATTAAKEFAAQWVGSAMEREYTPIPLVTLVMKNTDVPLVRAHWLNDEPLEAGTFELWVDQSLEAEDSKHPIRTQYIRSIRNPLRNLGIPLVVKDSLYKECFKHMEVPKFKTIREEKEFADAKLEKVLNEERRRYGVTVAPAPTNVAEATLVGQEFPF